MNPNLPTEPVYFLLVDDRDENLRALEALLRREGLVFLKARSGNEALELLLQYEVALALVDVQMPGMDGFELAELMRGTERTRRVPIIFVTAGAADAQRRFRGYEAGAVDFLNKPIEPDVLRSKADVFFDLCRQRQEVAQQRDELKAASKEIRRLLAESQHQAQSLREADQRKDEFLAVLAHELRNPLAPIRNAIEILRHGKSDPGSFDDVLEIATRQVGHMARLIDDLLDVARIARGKIELRTKACDLAEIARNTAEDYRPTYTSSGLTLDIETPAAPLIVAGDSTRLAQMIGNLLHNAGKFTPSGGRIVVSAVRDNANNMAAVKVKDTGAGFAMNQIARLFEPFGQLAQTLDRSKGGLGLGLALTKGLVDLHGGTISADSPGPGKGATFTLNIPLSAAPAARTDSKSPTNKSNVRPLKVLIIEDNADAAKSLELLLSTQGHAVEIAHDGDTGLAAAKERKPDVVISDLGLPGTMNGYSLAEAIRSDPNLSDVNLVALSGYGQASDRKRAHDAGFDVHLVKPVDFKELLKSLAAVTGEG